MERKQRERVQTAVPSEALKNKRQEFVSSETGEWNPTSALPSAQRGG